MFCKFCGSWLRSSYKFCPGCGKSPESSSTDTTPQPVNSYKSYVAEKSKERQSFSLRKPGNSKKAKMDETVTINIGIGYACNGVVKSLRGKGLPLKIAKCSGKEEVLNAAIEKRVAYDRTFRSDKTYNLVYPDGTDATTLPGTLELFSLEKYQEDLGKPYARLTLLLLPINEEDEGTLSEMKDSADKNTSDGNISAVSVSLGDMEEQPNRFHWEDPDLYELPSFASDFFDTVTNSSIVESTAGSIEHVPLEPPVEEAPPVSSDNNIPNAIRVIRVRRCQLKNDMLSIFSDPSILEAQLEAVIIDYAGNEEVGRGIGVLREIFTCFWKECYESLMVGVNERVPYVRHDYTREKWQSMARILLKGFEACYYFPLMLSQAYVISCLFGEASLSEEELIDSFKSYVSKSEEAVIMKSLTGTIACDDDELLDFLSDYDCKRVITKDSLPTIIKELAHKELIQKTQYISDCWIPILSQIQLLIPTVGVLRKMYEEKKPTTAKVLALLKAAPLTPAENETLSHLKRYIRSLDDKQLAVFLSFTTASDVIVTSDITISFTELNGIQRRPVSHTCGCTLELPCTYLNFCEFREEFNNVLNPGSWQMDIV